MNRNYWRSLFVLFSLVCHAPLAKAAPSFAIQPAVSTNLLGNPLQLALYQDGQPAVDPVGYQWTRRGTNLVDNDRITGSSTAVLSFSAVDLTDTGSYVLNFTNVVGTNVSRLFATGMVYVISMPEIVGELTTQTRGADVTFTVNATGGLLSYQWTWQGVDIPGATNSTLQFTNAYLNASGGYYNVRVSNPANPQGVTAANSLLFLKPAPNGTYQGLFYPATNAAPESIGFFEASVSSSKSTFSGKLVIGTQKYPFSGAFQPDHSAEVAVKRKTGGPLHLTMQLLTTNNLPQIFGSVEDPGWASSLWATRVDFTGKAASPLQGRYTLSLQNTNTSPSVPNGDCCATVVINKKGWVTLEGKAADSSKMSQSAGLSPVGDWPLYVSLNKERGRVAGWVRVQKQTSGSISGGPVVWVKDPGPDSFYPDGFGLLLQPMGSTFTKPITNSILNFTNGVTSLYGGDLFSGNDPTWSFIRLSITPPTVLTPEKSPESLQLEVKAATGWIDGHFKDLVTGRRASIWGVVLQQQSMARGFFTSTNTAGAFAITK